MPELAPLFVIPSEADKAINALDNDRKESFLFLEPRHTKSYMDFWYNPKYTPQEACDKAGNKAYLIFEVSRQTQILLKTLNPAYEVLGVPEGCAVDVHQDGTVTVTDNRPEIVNPPQIVPEERKLAPKLEFPKDWNGEGINPDFAPPSPDESQVEEVTQ